MRLFLILILLPLLAACSTTTQTTSGAAFLAARSGPVDPAVARAAAGEPDLRLPARIGLARVVNGQLTLPTEEELAGLPLPPGIGAVTIINPLISNTLDTRPRNPIRLAQLTAARQHQDYVLIYDISQIGRGLGKMGQANAVLMDVRSGYIYGTASVRENLGTYNGIWLGWARGYGLSDPAAARLARALAPEVVAMFSELTARVNG